MEAVNKGAWGELGGWFGGEVKLCVVGVGVKTEAVAADDLTEGEHVNGEQDWAKYRTLGDALVDWGRGGTGITNGDELFPVGEVGLKPGEC